MILVAICLPITNVVTSIHISLSLYVPRVGTASIWAGATRSVLYVYCCSDRGVAEGDDFDFFDDEASLSFVSAVSAWSGGIAVVVVIRHAMDVGMG